MVPPSSSYRTRYIGVGPGRGQGQTEAGNPRYSQETPLEPLQLRFKRNVSAQEAASTPRWQAARNGRLNFPYTGTCPDFLLRYQSKCRTKRNHVRSIRINVQIRHAPYLIGLQMRQYPFNVPLLKLNYLAFSLTLTCGTIDCICAGNGPVPFAVILVSCSQPPGQSTCRRPLNNGVALSISVP